MNSKIDTHDAMVIALIATIATLFINKMINKFQITNENWYDFYHNYASFDYRMTDIVDEMLMYNGNISGTEFVNGKRVPSEGKTHYYFFTDNFDVSCNRLLNIIVNQYAGFKKTKQTVNGSEQYVYEAWTAPATKEKMYTCVDDYCRSRIHNSTFQKRLAICDRQ